MKKKSTFILLVALLVIIALISITIGTANITPIDAMKILINHITGNPIEGVEGTIIINVRGPRILLALIVGAGLSISGAAFQGLFKNPMADPYILGVSSGAALGATMAIVFREVNGKFIIIGIAAFIGAIISITLVYNISKVSGKIVESTLLLSGVAINFLFSSIISLAMIMKRDAMDDIMYWTMGSFNAASYTQILIIAPIIIGASLALYFNYRSLNILSLDEESAYSLGVEIHKVKKRIIVLTSIMVALLVASSGIIGFVGLIIPHIARIFVGGNYKYLFPFSAVLGAIFVIICDGISRSILPSAELPVGIITSIFGAPYFIYLLMKRKRG